MLTEQESALARLLHRLICGTTTQEFIKSFLKSKGIATTAKNAEDLYSKRIQPALEDGTIQIHELRELLQLVEECGKQHTFLFQCTPAEAQAMISAPRVSAIADELGLTAVLAQSLDIDMPSSPTITSIRLAEAPRSMVIKVVETRSISNFVGEKRDEAAGKLVKEYTIVPKRAVNIAHLHENGLLELRVASQHNQTRYHENLQSLRNKLSKFLPSQSFNSVSLSKAKDRLLKEHETLTKDFRYSHSTARNEFGNVVQVSSATQNENLSSDEGSMDALSSFLAKDGHVIGTNVYVKIPNTDPLREIHILLSGDVNEFAVPVSCSLEEYAHVRDKVLELNH